MVQDFTSTNRSRTSGPWYLAIDPQHRIVRGKAYRIIKRAIDIAVVLMVSPLLLPLGLLVALLVYIDSPGRVLFTQLRTGKGGRRFRMYKFRSMVPNAEELKIKYAHLNELTWPDFKITNDPRITRVGKILRKTSLDELPQLLNVLKGDMSLVGPRPTSFAPETYRLWHTERLEVIPGITGLWQISGRSNLDFDQRLKLDIAYIERQSLWLDLQIVVRTAAQVFIGEGAY
jgi:lipopolysaccharide/colanic/teichoic acid biosynthesis glycosyltransferase